MYAVCEMQKTVVVIRQVYNQQPAISVGIATGYGLDGPGIEYRWGRDFPHLFRTALGPTQPAAGA
jgi:hypothetical protein